MGINTRYICLTALIITLVIAAAALEIHGISATGVWFLVFFLVCGTHWDKATGGGK